MQGSRGLGMYSHHCHLHVGEDVVLCLHLASNLDLLQAHRDGPGRNVEARQHEVDARPGDELECTAPLNNLEKNQANTHHMPVGGKGGKRAPWIAETSVVVGSHCTGAKLHSP